MLSIQTTVRPRFLHPLIAGGQKAWQGDGLQQEDAPLQGEFVDLDDLLGALALSSRSRTYKSVLWCHVDPDDPCSLRQHGPLLQWAEVYDRRPPEVTEADITEVVETYEGIRSFEAKRIKTLRLSLDRWNRSLVESRLDDRIIDLAIAFDCMYLHNLRDELRYRLGLRVAYHLGGDLQDRRNYSARMRKLYDARSDAVHSGTANSANKNKFDALVDLLQETQEWYRQGVRRIIAAGRLPDWEEMILE